MKAGRDITTGSIDIKTILRKYEQFYANKFDNIHELDTFLERHKLLPFISY